MSVPRVGGKAGYRFVVVRSPGGGQPPHGRRPYEGWVARQACSGVNPPVKFIDGSCPLPKARILHFYGNRIKALARAPKRLYAVT